MIRPWMWGLTSHAIGCLIWVYPGAASTPLPWDWVIDLQRQAEAQECRLSDLRRSPLLSSPDGRWQVYSRLDLNVDPSGADNLTSVLFARDTRTDRLQVIRSTSIPELSQPQPDAELDFILLIPMRWQGEALLVREHSGLFQSDIAEDLAVIWRPRGDEVQVIQPPLLPITELLGWDPLTPGRVLFAVGRFGDEPSLISIGDDAVARPHPLPIDAFASSVFSPPNPESEEPFPADSIPWEPGLPEITGPQCSSQPRQ